MKKRAVNFLVFWSGFFILMSLSVICFIFAKKEEKRMTVQFADYYFLDGSLISGDILLDALYDFSDERLRITVKTKKAVEGVDYIWDGERRIENYDINTGVNEVNYINKNAVFKVVVEKRGNKINCISFVQE